jgi:phosphocarrier protein HPr
MNDRYEKTFQIINDLGLHARAATKLVHLASRYPCEVEIANDEQKANAKSVMGVLLLCGGKGSHVRIATTGERALECLTAIGELIESRFGEAS